MSLVRLRNSNPSPPAFASLRHGTQSSPLAKGRGATTAVELTANEHYPNGRAHVKGFDNAPRSTLKTGFQFPFATCAIPKHSRFYVGH